nr:MAG TPA: hypothetical protein [Ackermannviridae sp.]
MRMTANPEFDAEVWYDEQMRGTREEERDYDDLTEQDDWDNYTED